jgi:hypothetical protein
VRAFPSLAVPNLSGFVRSTANFWTLISMFCLTYFARTFSTFSGIGYIDPWVNVGYGQTFPESSFPWHYYKESRFFTIISQFVLTKLGSAVFEIVICAIISLTTLFLFRTLRGMKQSYLSSFVLTSPLLLSTLLWGDAAGGIDYYNTFGNFITILFLSMLLKVTSQFQNLILNLKSLLAFGFISYLIMLEVPSGVILIFYGGIYLVISSIFTYLQNINASKSFEYKFFAKSLIFVISGFLLTLISQMIIYLILKEDPLKTLTGIQFLVNSILDSSVQRPWWVSITATDFIQQPYLRLFLFLIVSSLLFFLIFTFSKNTAIQNRSHQIRALNGSYFLTSVVIIALQLKGSSVAISLQYMSVPLLICGLLVFIYTVASFPTIKLHLAMSVLAVIVFISGYLLVHLLDRVLPILILAYVISVLVCARTKTNRLALTSLILATSILLPSIVQADVHFSISNGSAEFQKCENERKRFREDVLQLSILLDELSSPRGTTLLSADVNLLSQPLRSDCPAHRELTFGDALVSFSALGFPGVSILGPLSNEKGVSYPESLFANPLGREKFMDRCYFDFSDASSSATNVSKSVVILNNGAVVRLNCEYRVQ